MPGHLIEVAPSAYEYPLLIKHLLHFPMTQAPDQEIVYRDLRRHSYRAFGERIGRLASGLAELHIPARRGLLTTAEARTSAAATTCDLENIAFRWCPTSDSLTKGGADKGVKPSQKVGTGKRVRVVALKANG